MRREHGFFIGLMVFLFVVAFMGVVFTGCINDDSDDDPSSQNEGLSSAQRLADFEHLVHMVNKYYGPKAWKEDFFSFDLTDLVGRYRTQIGDVKNDMAFFEQMFSFINELHDGHTGFSIPSSYVAWLNFAVDLYDGKLIVDSISDDSLPLEIGDEIVSMDGEAAADLVARLQLYTPSGFDRCSKRWATTLVTTRAQSLYPEVVSGTTTLVIRGLDGTQRTESLAWRTSGTPWIAGDFEDMFSAGTGGESILDRLGRIELTGNRLQFQTNFGKYGHREPSFELPDGFVRRLGSQNSDEFYSGTWQAEGKTLGYIRVPKMYVNFAHSYADFSNEIIALNGMTDGLIIDIMDNPGGTVEWCNFMSSYLHTTPFPQIMFQLRPTLEIILEIESYVSSGSLPPELRAALQLLYNVLVETYTSNEWLTPPIPLDLNYPGTLIPPALDGEGNPVGYTKPIIILINDLSISGGDFFPATMQDSGRATLLGYRTAGGGGHVVSYPFEFPYSESAVSLTGSLMYRSQAVRPDGYPETHYIENVGVHPDIDYDYQTMADLMDHGRTYVTFFTAALLEKIE